jgi:hypothetical protein
LVSQNYLPFWFLYKNFVYISHLSIRHMLTRRA